jgi:hypothetical protein
MIDPYEGHGGPLVNLDPAMPPRQESRADGIVLRVPAVALQEAAERGGEAVPIEESADAAAYAGWVQLVNRIRTGKSDGMEELYQLFSKGIRFYLIPSS